METVRLAGNTRDSLLISFKDAKVSLSGHIFVKVWSSLAVLDIYMVLLPTESDKRGVVGVGSIPLQNSLLVNTFIVSEWNR